MGSRGRLVDRRAQQRVTRGDSTALWICRSHMAEESTRRNRELQCMHRQMRPDGTHVGGNDENQEHPAQPQRTPFTHNTPPLRLLISPWKQTPDVCIREHNLFIFRSSLGVHALCSSGSWGASGLAVCPGDGIQWYMAFVVLKGSQSTRIVPGGLH